MLVLLRLCGPPASVILGRMQHSCRHSREMKVLKSDVSKLPYKKLPYFTNEAATTIYIYIHERFCLPVCVGHNAYISGM
jgi:hypothetical protein